MISRFLRFSPLYQSRIWGGRAFENILGRALPDAQPYGESWEIVDRPEANSVIDGGAFAGQTLRQALQQNAAALMGPDWEAQRPFPILVKWLDAEDCLSLQVHPPASVAPELNGEPKTENWYVAACRPGASLFAGLKNNTDEQTFRKHLENNTLEQVVHRLAVRPGDSMFVHSGRIHAIDGGNLILEIQQNSDTTYRVYDWGRTGLDGKPRQLHVEASLRSIDFDDFEPELTKPVGKEQVLADDPAFRLRRISLQTGETLSFAAAEQPRILSLVQGFLQEKDGSTIPVSTNVLLPFAQGFTFTAAEPSTIVLTEDFCR